MGVVPAFKDGVLLSLTPGGARGCGRCDGRDWKLLTGYGEMRTACCTAHVITCKTSSASSYFVEGGTPRRIRLGMILSVNLKSKSGVTSRTRRRRETLGLWVALQYWAL